VEYVENPHDAVVFDWRVNCRLKSDRAREIFRAANAKPGDPELWECEIGRTP